MRLAKVLLLAAVLAWSAAPAIAETLEVGSKSPNLGDCEWIKGDPIDLSKVQGKQITVVEFWAKWCGPCVASIPHLTELQQAYADKNVRIVGVTKYDDDNTLEIVKEFVKDQGDKMDYAVAFDKSGDVFRSFMDAAGQHGIPTAFVVDKSGTIAWIGHPQWGWGLENVLAELVSGNFDMELAKKLFKIDQRGEKAWMADDFDAMLKSADDALELKPKSVFRWMRKFVVLADFLEKPRQAKKCAKQALKIAKGDPDKVARIASSIISDEDEYRCNKIASSALKKALKSAPENVDVRVAYFRALAATKKNKKALALAAETIDLMKGDSEKLSEFAAVLSTPARQDLCGDLALRAVELAIEVDPEEPRHYLSKFHILHECKKDKNAAIETGQYLIQLAAKDAHLLNEFARVLLTNDGTQGDYKGQYNELALAAAEQMHQAEGGKGWEQLGTLALAKFETGAIDEAIEIEKKAVEKCPPGPDKFQLIEALERFEKAKK